MLTAQLTSLSATVRCGRALASALRPPAVVTLEGDLGTGKTTLVRDVLRACGVRGVVVSPSFTIAQSYTGRGGLRLHHLDLYRLSPGDDVDLFAWDDYFAADAVTFVEWPEAGEGVLPEPTLRVHLFHETLHSRRLELRASVETEARLARLLDEAGLAASPSSSRIAAGGGDE